MIINFERNIIMDIDNYYYITITITITTVEDALTHQSLTENFYVRNEICTSDNELITPGN